MDSESLRIFCSVASELSVTQAATRLGRAPSSVTTRIQQLEADIGAELFVRTNKRMALTAAGERFLEYAQRLLALAEEARHVVTGGREGGTLRVGSMESTAASRLPALLAAYHARYPATRLALGTGPSRPLIEQVRTGLLDCAFVALPPAFGGAAALAELGLASKAVWREELCLLLPASEAQAHRAMDVRTRSLAAFPQGCTYRGIAEEVLGVAGSTQWRVQEMSSYHCMIACVAAGACVTLLPASVLALSGAPATLATISAGQIDTVLVWRAGFDVPAFQHLLAQFGEAA
ncbi:LysR substrate-binding domain-containing protein [Janthinobacterium sp. SUN206]|uniref:LysR substrate-binding domain-containing protein n=1 Tax=Janthinobacterium sp. SUN206 TaxID=3014787 RepID=UPI0027125D31|nr:LysR substrate-binding domain-containing protein [Janthinobacterium sp. SUN206]MDO8064568.1 LysR substrate-binding domain-containing protein [Janthinobacterium sp. SUN206]